MPWRLGATHALVLDGVFAEDGSGQLRVHPATPPTDDETDPVLATIERRVRRLLARRGAIADDDGGGAEGWAEEAPGLAGMTAASVRGRMALGPRAGAEVRRWASPEALLPSSVRGPCHAHQHGFDLPAGVVVPGRERARLERMCCEALRPPVAHERIRLTSAGQVLLALRQRWSDGRPICCSIPSSC